MDSRFGRDEDLLAELRDALEEEARVPEGVREAAYAAYAWRTVDAELAALTYDSLLAPPELAGARSHDRAVRSLTFTAGPVTVELSVEGDTLLGQLVPPKPGEVRVDLEDGPGATVDADVMGCFTLAPLPTRPFRLAVVASGVVTDWVRL